MYTVTVCRDFIAQHFLTVPDPGPEGEVHSHHFETEVRLAGETLNEYDYLVDIDDIRTSLDAIEARYRDETLNDLPEFKGHNPSVERFARVVCDRLVESIDAPHVNRIEVVMWEDDDAAAAFDRAT